MNKFLAWNGFDDARFLVVSAFAVGLFFASLYIAADQLAGGPWKVAPTDG